MSSSVTAAVVAHIAQLANLNVTAQEQQQFALAFQATMDEVQKLHNIDVQTVAPTHSVTGLVNVWRADDIDTARQLTQAQAVGCAAHTLRGYVVVDRILEENS